MTIPQAPPLAVITIPFLDLKAQYASIKEEIDAAIKQVVESCAFSSGPFVQQFEKEFASFCGCNYAVGVGNGTEGLWLALTACGVGPGDEVITVPNTFIATAEAISHCGAKPVFVDIDERTYTMDPEKLSDYLRKSSQRSSTGRRAKAVIPVHLYGQMAEMDSILTTAKEHGLYVIEDASQAHGAAYKGKPAGSMGDMGCFSFYPGKNLGAYGEAGAVVTNDVELASKIKILKDHGQEKKYYHRMVGWNGRMDGIQGAVLSVKLRYLPEWNQLRRRNARWYDELISATDGIICPTTAEFNNHVYHIYAIRIAERDRFIESLSARHVSCGIHYPVPLHLTPAYEFLHLHRGSFPEAEKCATQLVSLPMYPELSREQIEYTACAIHEFVAQHPPA